MMRFYLFFYPFANVQYPHIVTQFQLNPAQYNPSILLRVAYVSFSFYQTVTALSYFLLRCTARDFLVDHPLHVYSSRLRLSAFSMFVGFFGGISVDSLRGRIFYIIFSFFNLFQLLEIFQVYINTGPSDFDFLSIHLEAGLTVFWLCCTWAAAFRYWLIGVL